MKNKLHKRFIVPEHNFGSYIPPTPEFSGVKTSSFYVLMHDGVELAVDVDLPENIPEGYKIPALLVQTRYWRQLDIRWPFNLWIKPGDTSPDYRDFKPFFTAHGYAIVTVDVRGTGASYGTWPHPWPRESIEDSRTLVEWITQQPWSNGKIGTHGVSYLGTTAELLSAINHPAVKAIIPMFNHPDGYTDIAFPGGVFNQRFIQDWGRFDRFLDSNTVPPEYRLSGRLVVKGVKPVQGPTGRKKLKAAVKEHLANGNVFQLAKSVTFRDEYRQNIDICVDDITLHKHNREIKQAQVPTFGFGSWMDAGTADAVIRRFLSFDHPQWAVIGAWEHGGRYNASPYQVPGEESSPPLKVQWAEMLHFYNSFLKSDSDQIHFKKILHYYTMGEEKWKCTHTWPPEGTSIYRYFLDNNHTLSLQKPTCEQDYDTYRVDFEATTGMYNRWWAMSSIYNTTVEYPDLRDVSAHMICYTSPVLQQDIEITGHPVVTLFISSSEPDCVFYVYLEDVHPQGKVTYITEGILRALHRRVCSQTPPFKLLVPYHSFKKVDAQPLEPGELARITLGLLPTSVLIRKGHRIRISIAGHDKGTFVRIPETSVPVYTIQRNQQFASYIDLPVITS